MDNLKEHSPITPESVLATVEAILVKVAAEFDRRSAAFDREMKKTREDLEQERKKSNEDFERERKKVDEKFEQERKKANEDFYRRSADFDRRMKKLSEQIGGLSNNHGSFAEEYFFNSFENGKKTFFGEKFDLCKKNVPGFSYEDEYDIVLLNGQSVGIVEIKYKAHDKDIANVIRKVNSFKINYPGYSNHRFYLGLASLIFAGEVEGACINSGIAVIKQVGETVVINDGHLKVF